jgi:beta-phosphoglucomutase-like phosphatase (HAD superfamily)
MLHAYSGIEDPMEVLRLAAAGGASVRDLAVLDEKLSEFEVRAVAGASPTHGSHDLVANLFHQHVPAAVVSNNSARSVRAYWSKYCLPELPVFGRPRADPRRMKPSPYLLLSACAELGVDPAMSVLVGDSVTDVEAARSAGTMAIGYANKPGKAVRLQEAGADAIALSMNEVDALLMPPKGSEGEG